jgi:hypothetical protein
MVTSGSSGDMFKRVERVRRSGMGFEVAAVGRWQILAALELYFESSL